ncbi:MAG: hypothetical protein HZB51_15120 [Chloroflexi bacterium]|nr:hypothetical protein [Chloroflexota bacterium]
MNRIVRLVATLAIITLFVGQFVIGIPAIVTAMSAPLQNPNRSYEEKMRGVWGDYFDLMQFIQTKTSDNAVILIDPKYQYAILNLYFLHPRKLIYGSEAVLQSHSEIDYVLISEDFPDFAVAGEKIMLDDKQGLYKVRK